jgi:hypothetical protein
MVPEQMILSPPRDLSIKPVDDPSGSAMSELDAALHIEFTRA